MNCRYVFTAQGGHGSIYIMDKLQSLGLDVHRRPDTYICPQLLDGWRISNLKSYYPTWRNRYQLLSPKELRDRPNVNTCRLFRERAEYRMSRRMTFNSNLLRYVKRLQQSRRTTALFSNIVLVNFFSLNNIEDVVFIIRHPLHAYISLTVNRHPMLKDAQGGFCSEESVLWWANVWNAAVAEYIACKVTNLQPVCIRYEYAQRDAENTGDSLLIKIFRGLRSGRRNYGALSKELEEVMRNAVWDMYTKLYREWKI